LALFKTPLLRLKALQTGFNFFLKEKFPQLSNRKFSIFIDRRLFAGCKMGDNPFFFRIDEVPVEG
jgi:hypothetical protein